jgi:hypothetical protein
MFVPLTPVSVLCSQQCNLSQNYVLPFRAQEMVIKALRTSFAASDPNAPVVEVEIQEMLL